MKFIVAVDCEGVACAVGSPGASLNESRDLQFAQLQATREADACAKGLFDAGAEATFGDPEHDNFLAEHMLIAFGKPGGRRLDDGTLLTWFWCTSGGVTHTRWVRLELA